MIDAACVLGVYQFQVHKFEHRFSEEKVWNIALSYRKLGVCLGHCNWLIFYIFKTVYMVHCLFCLNASSHVNFPVVIGNKMGSFDILLKKEDVIILNVYVY